MCSAGYQLDAECNLPCFHCNPQITSSVKDWKSEEHQASSFFKFAPNGIVITSPASSSYYILHFLCCDKKNPMRWKKCKLFIHFQQCIHQLIDKQESDDYIFLLEEKWE